MLNLITTKGRGTEVEWTKCDGGDVLWPRILLLTGVRIVFLSFFKHWDVANGAAILAVFATRCWRSL